MNITLSADDTLIEKARKYASARNTTLNQIVRDYLTRLVGEVSGQEAAEEFEVVARNMGGRSPDGWVWDRNAALRDGAAQ